MKRYVRASITSEVNDIVNNKKDTNYHINETLPHRTEEDVMYEVRNDNIDNLEITKYEPGDPDYQKYRNGLNSNYQGTYYIGRWKVPYRYNSTKYEELNAILKRIRTVEEANELYWAIYNVGDGTWIYTKRGNNPLNGTFEPVPNDPESVAYIVDRHSAVLKCKISNLYKVLTIR